MFLITGANGQLGRCLRDMLGENGALYTDAAELDITDLQAVQAFGAEHHFSAIINCAAYTNVDKAEEEPALARRINVTGTENLAKLAAARHVPLVHISTDYVFDGTAHTPIPEDAPARPTGVYGQTKKEAEEAVFKYAETACIIRTAWLYSPYGKNFVKTMLELGRTKEEIRVVADQIGTPTYAPHLAEVILNILPRMAAGKKEIYHFTDSGVCSWYDLAYYTVKQAGCRTRVLPITTGEYPARAQRPAYSVLSKEKIKKAFGIVPPHWTQGVEECLKKLC